MVFMIHCKSYHKCLKPVYSRKFFLAADLLFLRNKNYSEILPLKMIIGFSFYFLNQKEPKIEDRFRTVTFIPS